MQKQNKMNFLKSISLLILLFQITLATHIVNSGYLCVFKHPCKNGGLCNFDNEAKQPSCTCPKQWTGLHCEIQAIIEQIDEINRDDHPVSHYDPCSKKECFNGGQCFISNTGNAECQCPILYRGESCEIVSYIPCPSLTQLCSNDHGSCQNGDTCVCQEGYGGERCDEEERCDDSFCENGGTCVSLTVQPFRVCSCPPNYTGRRCDVSLLAYSLVPLRSSICNYTIKIHNTGAFYSRFSVVYSKGQIRQPLIISDEAKILGNTASVTIDPSFENVSVLLEIFTGFSWRTIHEDKNLGLSTECTKCYKLWGSVLTPKWDYYLC